MSQVTTHVLDTSRGKPAWGIPVILYKQVADDWIEVARGITNKDGRITNLLPEGSELPYAIYKMKFDTLHHFDAIDVETFYPTVEITFSIKTNEHYHIPLLISPYGYSTYRGS